MKKAVPKPARPFSHKTEQPQAWRKTIASYDRYVRRRNKLFKDHVLRVDHETIRLIKGDRTLHLDILNSLNRVRDYEE